MSQWLGLNVFCAVWEKVFAILLRILWKEISLQGLGFHVAGSNALVLLKIHWKSCIFPQFSFFPYPLCCCWWNKILSMKKFEGKNACLLGWLFKKNQMFGLYCLRLVFLITDAYSSLWAREAKRCRKTRNLSFSSRFFLRFISFGKVFCCVLNQRQLYFTG